MIHNMYIIRYYADYVLLQIMSTALRDNNMFFKLIDQ